MLINKDYFITAFNRLEKESQRVYSNLALGYPALLKAMEEGFSSSKAVINDFTFVSNSSSNGKSKERLAIETTKNLIDEKREAFEQLHSQDYKLFDSINESIDLISTLDKTIKIIKEDTQDIELVSLNAMIFAIKAGKAGGAFSYITEELKRVSSEIIFLTRQLNDDSSVICKLFKDYRSSVNDIKEYQNALFKGFGDQLDNCYVNFQSEINNIVSTLSKMLETSGEINTPLLEMMTEIQIQDIVKQSIDHITFSIKKVDETKTNLNEEELLDEYLFEQTLSDLCMDLLDEIGNQIKKNLDLFKDKTKKIEDILFSGEEKRNFFLDQLLNEKKAKNTLEKDEKSGNIFSCFQNSAETIENLVNDFEKTWQQKKIINKNSRFLMSRVNNLKEKLDSFSDLIYLLSNINVVSKIEVVKQNVLSGMGDNIDDMEVLTIKIEENVDTVFKIIKDFSGGTQFVITGFSQTFKNEEVFLRQFKGELNSGYEDLFKMKDKLLSNLSSFSLFNDSFVSLFDSTRTDLKSLDGLVDNITEVKVAFMKLKQDALDKYNLLCRKKNIKNWTLKNDKMKELIKRFTIFQHKKKAGKISGFTVEEDILESGEVELF